MRVLRSLLVPLPALLACACIGFVGCGGGDGDSTAAESDGLSSEPARLVKDMLRQAAAAKKAKDCKDVREVNRRSRTKIVCPPFNADVRKANKATKPVRAATYGSAAVVDYKSPGAKKGASIILYRNAGGEWTIGHWGLLYGSSVGTEADDRDDSQTIVESYLAAVRERDCGEYNKVALTQSSELKVVCKQEFPSTEPLAEALKANPGVQPRHIGGNEDFNFWRLDLTAPKPKSYTLSTTGTPEGSLRPQLVLAAEPAPTDG